MNPLLIVVELALALQIFALISSCVLLSIIVEFRRRS